MYQAAPHSCTGMCAGCFTKKEPASCHPANLLQQMQYCIPQGVAARRATAARACARGSQGVAESLPVADESQDAVICTLVGRRHVANWVLLLGLRAPLGVARDPLSFHRKDIQCHAASKVSWLMSDD
jgi:hypothetical protein